MERLSDYVFKVHATWLASSFSCCFPGSQERSVEAKEKELELDSAISSRRHSPIPLSSMTYRQARKVPPTQLITLV